MKKTLSLILVAVMVLSLAACGSKANTKITVVSREDGSGTRGAFVELTGVEEKNAEGVKVDNTTVDADITDSTSVMLTYVSGNENAIGYISLGSLNDTVKAVSIDGAAANVENIKSGTYKLSRPFNIATKGTLTEAAEAFMSFILSEEGQAVIESNGYIAVVENAAPYAAGVVEGKVVVSGSSSVTPVMEKLKEAYLKLNPSAQIEIQQSDSSTGMNNAIDGTCDIGMASRELKDSEIASGLKATVIAMDGIAVIINNANEVADLSLAQVKDIYTGSLTSWDKL